MFTKVASDVHYYCQVLVYYPQEDIIDQSAFWADHKKKLLSTQERKFLSQI